METGGRFQNVAVRIRSLQKLRKSEKPAIGSLSHAQKRKFSETRNVWLATQCSSRPSLGELPANREFYREICDFPDRAGDF
nr:hypothetical protein [Afipia sp.]